MTDLATFFHDAGTGVDAALDRLLPPAEAEPANLNAAIRWSIFGGGKRFRPALLIAAGRVFGAPDDDLWATAAAVEMVHTYSLIHDDLPAMDDDKLRRGRATCHVKFGEATAILAGDALQALAFRVIADDERLDAAVRLQLVRELGIAAGRMVAGQHADLEAEGRRTEIAEIEAIHRNKTGALICFAARAGCLIAGASREELRAVTKYSAKLGLLFQITDDVLDATQSTETLGKTAAKDEAAEKATYVSVYGAERAKELANEMFGEAAAELETVERPTDILRELGEFVKLRKA